jgi:hypothetical protein
VSVILKEMRLLIAVLLLLTPAAAAEKLQPQTLEAWNAYQRGTEARINSELNGANGAAPKFLSADYLSPADSQQARATRQTGRVWIRRIAPPEGAGRDIQVPDGMIHHWLGVIFLPGAKLDALLEWVQKYDEHHRYFDEVERSRLIARRGDTFDIYLRFKRKKIITVHYNTHHTVIYQRHSPHRASSRSAATRIAELEDAGRPGEKEKPIGDDSGFLWRINSYWRFDETPEGVYLECESISLSRGIPRIVAWAIRGYVTSVPRESLERTLESIRKGYRQ